MRELGLLSRSQVLKAGKVIWVEVILCRMNEDMDDFGKDVLEGEASGYNEL